MGLDRPPQMCGRNPSISNCRLRNARNDLCHKGLCQFPTFSVVHIASNPSGLPKKTASRQSWPSEVFHLKTSSISRYSDPIDRAALTQELLHPDCQRSPSFRSKHYTRLSVSR
jgi:hypothetical protein